MKTTMTFFPVTENGVVLRKWVDLPTEPTYAELKLLIEPLLGGDGVWMEHVAVRVGDAQSDMFVDDNGVWKELPRNDAATDIYRAATLARHPDMDPENLDFIVGPAVLFDRPVWF